MSTLDELFLEAGAFHLLDRGYVIFRWIKQHLSIKAFYGTSENAVKTQVWVAVSVYVLLAIVKKQLGLDLSLYKILQILSVTVFGKTPYKRVFRTSATNFRTPSLASNRAYSTFNGTAPREQKTLDRGRPSHG
jgi:hypothetical protein